MPLNKSSRSAKMDIIRLFALFTVNCVHFFLFSNLYEQPINSFPVYFAVILRTFFMICVPLFIMLSGYLMKNKKLGKAYYFGIVKTLSVYILASAATYLYRTLYLKENISILSFGTGVLDFSIAPYSWYVEMYIGLFLLIPFLNLAYNGLESQNQRKILVLTMIFITAAPSILNIWNFSNPAFYLCPSSFDRYNQLVPQWWTEMYPITFYFIGCYLRDYGLGLSKLKNIVLATVCVILGGAFNIYRSFPNSFLGEIWQDWGAFINVINSALIFNLLLNINDAKIPQKLLKPLNKLSNLVFGAYLMSWVFDDLFYSIFISDTQPYSMKIKYILFIPAMTFICSLAVSFVLNLIYSFIRKIISTALQTKNIN